MCNLDNTETRDCRSESEDKSPLIIVIDCAIDLKIHFPASLCGNGQHTCFIAGVFLEGLNSILAETFRPSPF
ncbi:MAG: hypothetical protein PVG39_23705 [Desulfobacteraceae bacterium]